jgi:MYXO-CTERM domain-containing protein
MLLLVPAAFAFDSDPAPVVLEDEAELFTNTEYSTGTLPSGSPIGVEFAIEANGGAAVTMEGEGALSWPDALTLEFTGAEGSGIYLLDASLDAVTTVNVDLSDYGYSGSFEIDRRTLTMDGATFFDPFVLPGAPDERVEVVDTSAGTQLIQYSYDIFGGVASLEFTADMTPTFTAGFEGVQWTAGEATITAEDQPVTLTPEREPDFDVDGVFTAAWDARFDLVFTPTLSVCASFVGCIDVASFDIPVQIASDSFDQDFPPDTYSFPLPLLEPGIESGDFGTIAPGEVSNLQVPLEDVGDLAVYGTATIEGTGEFSVYPDQFNALPGTTDGVVVTFAPTAEGEQTADLILTSNDPSIPTLTIPLVGNAESPNTDNGSDVGGDDDKISAAATTCGCESTSPVSSAWAALGGLALLIRRRRA